MNKYLQVGALAVALVAVVVVLNQKITQPQFDIPPIPVLPGHSPLAGQVPSNFNVFLASETQAGVVVPADDHNFVVAGGTGNAFGLLVGALATDTVKRFWMYEYTGTETRTSFPGRFYISAGEFAAQDTFTQNAYNLLLQRNGEITTFRHGKTYYVMAEIDTYFKTGIGLSFATASAECGNGVLESGEECDDGNLTGGDGCSDMCEVEPGFVCINDPMPSVCASTCGNGTLDSGEECDDGNQDNDDGCSDMCEVEPGFVCINDPMPSVCTSTCGNGVLESGEECDDGNLTVGDGCSDMCEVEPGFVCINDPMPSVCASTCGNGVLESGEECDDGDQDNGDGCSDTCEVEPGFVCINDPMPSVCASTCGDGTLDPGEECDDGNLAGGDGCSDICTVEHGFVCTGTEPSVCVAPCGDGLISSIEQCDDGGLCDDGETVCYDDSHCATGETCTPQSGDGCSDMCDVEDAWECEGEPSNCSLIIPELPGVLGVDQLPVAGTILSPGSTSEVFAFSVAATVPVELTDVIVQLSSTDVANLSDSIVSANLIDRSTETILASQDITSTTSVESLTFSLSPLAVTSAATELAVTVTLAAVPATGTFHIAFDTIDHANSYIAATKEDGGIAVPLVGITTDGACSEEPDDCEIGITTLPPETWTMTPYAFFLEQHAMPSGTMSPGQSNVPVMEFTTQAVRTMNITGVQFYLTSQAGVNPSTLLSSVRLVNTSADPDEELLAISIPSGLEAVTLTFDLTANPQQVTATQPVSMEVQVDVHTSAPNGSFWLQLDTDMDPDAYVTVTDGGTFLQGIATNGLCDDPSGTCEIGASVPTAPTWSVVAP